MDELRSPPDVCVVVGSQAERLIVALKALRRDGSLTARKLLKVIGRWYRVKATEGIVDASFDLEDEVQLSLITYRGVRGAFYYTADESANKISLVCVEFVSVDRRKNKPNGRDHLSIWSRLTPDQKKNDDGGDVINHFEKYNDNDGIFIKNIASYYIRNNSIIDRGRLTIGQIKLAANNYFVIDLYRTTDVVMKLILASHRMAEKQPEIADVSA